MHFTCRSFIGKSGTNFWCQYWENEADDPQIAAVRGHLFALVEFSSNNENTIRQRGHEFISELNTRYFTLNSIPNPEHLKQCYSQLKTQFSDLTIESLALCLVFQQQVLFQLAPHTSAVMIRNNKMSLPIVCPENQISFQLIGPSSSIDGIVLMTDKLKTLLGWEKIKNIFSSLDFTLIEEVTIAAINSQSDQTGLAASLVKITVELEEDSPPSPEIIDVPPITPTKSRKPLFVTAHQSSELSHRKKINLIIASVLLILLGISVAIGFQKNKQTQNETRYQKLQSEITKTLSDGYAIKNLNLDTAKTLGQKSATLLTQMKALKTNNHQSEMNQFQSQIQSLLSQTGSSDPTQNKEWYDTSLIINAPEYRYLTFQNDTLYILDTKNGRLDQINTLEKSTKLYLQHPDLKDIKQLIVSNNQVLGLTAEGIVLITKDQVKSVLAASAVSAGLWNDLLYLLDTSANTIQKVTSSSSGFGTLTSWLKEGQAFPRLASSIAINGKIWVLSSDGTITPYLRGVKDSFKLSQPISSTNARNLVVGIDSDILAFIDNDNSVYVIQKNGVTQAKYTLGNKISSITLDEKNSALYALCSDQKIYKINL